jgi:hypothetical protein
MREEQSGRRTVIEKKGAAMKNMKTPRDFRTVTSRTSPETANGSSDHAHARVAALAYIFYEERGRKDGHDVEDWIRAENTIREELGLRINGSRMDQEV